MNADTDFLAFAASADWWIEQTVQRGTKAVELHKDFADGCASFDTAAEDVIADILWAVFEGDGTLDDARWLLERAFGHYATEIHDDFSFIAMRRALGRVRDKSNDDWELTHTNTSPPEDQE